MTQTLKLLTAALSLLVLAGCGAGEEEPNMGAAMSAIGGAVPTPAGIEPTQIDAPLEIEVEDTKSLIVSDDFAFDTSQHINIDFDLLSARGSDASVSICTSYGEDHLGYDIDYDSCTVQGDMIDGVFNHAMEVTNEFEKVVAVVWFQDKAIDPVYREFSVGSSSSDRAVRSIGREKVIVWR